MLIITQSSSSKSNVKSLKRSWAQVKHVRAFKIRKLIVCLDGYELYQDPQGALYNVTLARKDMTVNWSEGCRLKVGRLSSSVYPYYSPRRTRVPIDRPHTQRLQLFQTHTAPRYYACYVTYFSSSTRTTSFHTLAPKLSSFQFALGQFEQFFMLKTRMLWNNGDFVAEGHDPRQAEQPDLLKPQRQPKAVNW